MLHDVNVSKNGGVNRKSLLFILSVVGADLSVQSVARCKIIGLRLGGCCSADKLLLLFYLVLEFVLILTKQYNIECNNVANTLKWEKLTDFILEKKITCQ